MRAIIVLDNIDFFYQDDDYIVGIESSALTLESADIKCDLVIGDFDSCTEEEIALIKANYKYIELDSMKDDSDTEYAVKYLINEGYDDIVILGGLGKRFDHSIVNYLLVYKYGITIHDNHNVIYRLDTGGYIQQSSYKYLAVFALEEAVITLSGVKYPLTDRVIDKHTTYTVSNEAIDGVFWIKVEGSVVVIESKD